MKLTKKHVLRLTGWTEQGMPEGMGIEVHIDAVEMIRVQYLREAIKEMEGRMVEGDNFWKVFDDVFGEVMEEEKE